MMIWLASNLLWLGLILLLSSALIGIGYLSGIGWMIFSAYWLIQSIHYYTILDYFNVAVTLAAASFSIYLAWLISIKGRKTPSIHWISRAAAICGLLYFPFAEIPELNRWLISSTTRFTTDFLQGMGVSASLESWNLISLNGMTVEIVLACTAIESIALFSGIILSVHGVGSRRLMALILSTVAIYLLNLMRNAFVVLAYGEQWFGEESFYIAHNVIAKVGSTLALLAIAYVVFHLLPELLNMIDDLVVEMRSPGGRVA